MGVSLTEGEEGRDSGLFVVERLGIDMLCRRDNRECEGAPDSGAACIDMASNGTGEVLLTCEASSSSSFEDEAKVDFPMRNMLPFRTNE